MEPDATRSSQSSPETETTEKRRPKTPYPFLFRWVHWLLMVSMAVLILTGLSLHAGSRPEWSLLSGKVPAWLWTGRVHYWHAWAGLLFAPSILVACWAYVRGPVIFRPTHVILLAGGFLALASGFLLGNPPGSDALYSAALWIHAVVGMVVLPVWFLWHLFTGLTRYKGMLVHAFRPWANGSIASIVGLVVLSMITSCVLLNGWPLQPPWRNLVASRIPGQETDDLAALPWDEAKPLVVQLANGASMDAGRTRVALRALHDGNGLFVKAEWADDDENYDYWPWKKTTDGWEYLQTSSNDECQVYEDKFSLVFPIEPDADFERFGCTASCHLNAEYGWGYKGSARPLDVWHWKAARTGSIGYVDDKFWSEVDLDNKDIGRHGDPNEGGGYTKNAASDVDHPLFLPEPPESVVHGSFPKEHAAEYTDQAASALAPGTLIPGVVTEAFLGDRANVTCESHYANGRWTLLMRRQLLTNSEYDVQFAPGGSHAFGCAAFDHAGKRHAHALPIFHLVLEK